MARKTPIKKLKHPFVIGEFKFKSMKIEGNKAIFDFYYDDIKHTKTLTFPLKLPKNDKVTEFILCNIAMCYLIQSTFFAFPKKISIDAFSLDKKGQEFWKKYFINISSQKYFLDKIPFKYKPKFIFRGKTYDVLKKWKTNNKIITSFGGGKDSILQQEMLNKAGLKFDLFHMIHKDTQSGEGRDALFLPLLNQIKAKRKALVVRIKTNNNPQKIFNYKKPVTDTTIPKSAFMMLLFSRLMGYRYIAIANEKSAQYGNTVWDNHVINHQYGKSPKFLIALNNYIHRYITPSVYCFSALEQWYEFKIMDLFSRLKGYFEISISCNMLPEAEKGIKWCCNCPKCAFTYTMARGFMGPERANEVVGNDLFKRLDLIKPLSDPESIKPFECVGEKEEMWLALNMCYERGEKAPAIDYYKKHILPKIKHRLHAIRRKCMRTYSHHIPKKIWKRLLKGVAIIEN